MQPADQIDPYEIFLGAIKKPATKKMYTYAFDQYLDFCKTMEPADLLKSEIPEIENRVMQYIQHLNNDKFSNSMRNIHLSAIRLFYYMNDKVLNWDKMLRLKQEKRNPRKDRAYSKGEISAMLKLTSSARERAILLIYATSGIRKDALLTMKIKDLQYLESEKTFALTVYAGDTEEYHTFVTPQASKYIARYLKERFKTTKGLFRDKGDQYLIGNEYYPDHPASVDSIERLIKTLALKIGIRPEDGNSKERKEIMLVHGFRKFFNTTLANITGFNLLYKESLMGHKVGLEDSYLRPTTEQLLTEYKKAGQVLTFDISDL